MKLMEQLKEYTRCLPGPAVAQHAVKRVRTSIAKGVVVGVVVGAAGVGTFSNVVQAEPVAPEYTFAEKTPAELQRRAEAMRRALARKIPFSEVTINRLGNLADDADIYEPQLYIRFNDDGVTVQASQVKLERLLQDLCWQGGFDLDLRLDLPEAASLTMHDAQLSQVLSVLLREYSYVLTNEADGLVSKLVVMSRDETTFGDELIQEASIDLPTPQISLTDYMSEGDANMRRDLLRSQAGDTSEQVIAFFQSVMEVEPEIAIRAQALALLSVHPSRSVDTVLAEVASDPSAELRLEAAQRLMGRDQAQAMELLGQLAFGDSDPKVRARALVMLEQMPKDTVQTVWASAREQLARDRQNGQRYPVAPVSVPVSLPMGR